MRGAWIGLLALLLTGGCAAPVPSGGGVVSTNPCADAMLVELAPERIAAISHYSLDAAATSIPLEVARRYRTTAGTAEEVIALRPELVVASSFTASSTREAFRRAGLKALYLDSPTTIEASKRQLAELAAAVGAEARGRAAIARIDAAVAGAATAGPPVPALVWIGGNLVSGGGTLLSEMLAKAGFRDAASDYGLRFTGYLPIEHVVAKPPRVMLVPDGQGRDADSRAAQLRTRALASGAKVVQAEFPRRLLNCGGPVIAAAITRLAEVRRGL